MMIATHQLRSMRIMCKGYFRALKWAPKVIVHRNFQSSAISMTAPRNVGSRIVSADGMAIANTTPASSTKIAAPSIMLKLQMAAERADLNELITTLKNEILPYCQSQDSNQPFSIALKHCLSTLEGSMLQSSMVSFIKELNNEGLLKTLEDWNEVIKYISRFRDHPTEMVEIVSLMLNNGFIPADKELVLISRSLMASKQTKQMVSLINILLSQKAVPPTDMLLNAISLAVTTHEYQLAYEILKEWDAIAGRNMVAAPYTILLDAIVDQEHFKELTIKVLELMHFRNYRRHMLLSNLYMDEGRLDDALEIFHQAMIQGAVPRAGVLFKLAKQLTNAGRPEQVEPLIIEYLNSSMTEHTASSWGCAMYILADVLGTQKAEEFIAKSCAYGIEPTEVLFRGLFSPMLVAEDLLPKQSVVEAMKNFVSPNSKRSMGHAFRTLVNKKKDFPTLLQFTGAMSLLAENIKPSDKQTLLELYEANIDSILVSVKNEFPASFVEQGDSHRGLCSLLTLSSKLHLHLLIKTSQIYMTARSALGDSMDVLRSALSAHYTADTVDALLILQQLHMNVHLVQDDRERKWDPNFARSMGQSSYDLINKLLTSKSPTLPWTEHVAEAIALFKAYQQADLIVLMVDLIRAKGMQLSRHCIVEITETLRKTSNVEQLMKLALDRAVVLLEESKQSDPQQPAYRLRNEISQTQLLSNRVWFLEDSHGNEFTELPPEQRKAPTMINYTDGVLLYEALEYTTQHYSNRKIDTSCYDEIASVFDRVYVLVGAAKLIGFDISDKSLAGFIRLAILLIQNTTDTTAMLSFVSRAMDCVDVAMSRGRIIRFSDVRILLDTAIRVGTDAYVVELFEIHPQKFIFSCMTSYQLEFILKALIAEKRYLLALQSFEFAIRKRDSTAESVCKDPSSWGCFLDGFSVLYSKAARVEKLLASGKKVDEAQLAEDDIPSLSTADLKQLMFKTIQSASSHNQLLNASVLAKLITVMGKLGLMDEAVALIMLAAEGMRTAKGFKRNHISSILVQTNIKEKDQKTLAWNELKKALDVFSDAMLTSIDADNKDLLVQLERLAECRNVLQDFFLL